MAAVRAGAAGAGGAAGCERDGSWKRKGGTRFRVPPFFVAR